MAEPEPVPSIFELNYTDLTLYKHPPFMFALWYLTMAFQKGWEVVKDLIDQIMAEGSSPPPPPPEEAPAEDAPAEDAPPADAPA